MKIVWSKVTGFVRRYIIPNFLLGHEKALAAPVAAFIVVQIAPHIPRLHLSVSAVAQVVLYAMTGLGTWATKNTSNPVG